MKILVTGGAGFIGRWVVKKLLRDGHHVWVIDNLSNGSLANLEEFVHHPNLIDVRMEDISQRNVLEDLFKVNFDLCFHLAASINVQDSIDDPLTTFSNDTLATFYLLEECRKHEVKLVFMSTCMVYDHAVRSSGIEETDPLKPTSPYAGAKIAAENLVLSYFYAYGLPVVILRPFNTYGPFQKTNGEGGVVSIFIQKKLKHQPLQIYGDGTQTRDLLYVADCANFVVEAGYSNRTHGEIIHAGTSIDYSINELAQLIQPNTNLIQHVEHIHPQSEIKKLQCNYLKAKTILNWEPRISLQEGIRRTEWWVTNQYHKEDYN